MNTHEARKVTCEKVRVSATLGDRNLRIPQGRMCRKKIYSAYRKSLPVATETGVGPNYNLIGCVKHVCQQTDMLGVWVKFSAHKALLPHIIWGRYSSLAQLVEQSAVNRLVGDSSPSRGATFLK